MTIKLFIGCAVLAFQCFSVHHAFLVIPEDVGTGFAAIYGFSPRISIGRDHRVGFGFSFGNHADLQILYELGPQTSTKPLESNTKVRSAVYQQRARRRPFLELLVRAGVLLESTVSHNGIRPNREEPRSPISMTHNNNV